ncbi:PAS-domain containing protein [uncultured Litoreibacter sp.]|uniref:PAS-domain containing protein n=1 Tax=uncultured Litoreibacter sp. TaxID=1392394 RepID=UPI0026223F40|nr:PAS-domain containing protein [uncultured Litoreibacter sp.]
MTALLFQPAFFLFAAGLATGLLGCFALRKSRPSPPTSAPAPSAQIFTFEGEELVGVNAPARAALSAEDLEQDTRKRLIQRLADIFPQFPRALDIAMQESAAFELSELTTSGPVSASVACDAGHCRITVSGLPNLMASRVLMDRDVSESVGQELAILQGTVATSPTVIWREDRVGNIDWVNASYVSLVEQFAPADQEAWPPRRLFEGGQIAAPGEKAHPRRSPLTLKDGTTRWFDITSFGHGNTTLHYACDASKTVQAEESLRNFMQTLTQTFAALPIGLAIFDRSRQLQLFNPALMDLTNLEPEWLAARPTLYDTVNRLREKRMLPERKDFNDWRAKINELEKLAVNGTYMETWILPSGQTYKVTGRPHPEGAVAFLIEDISAEVSLTRKFRRELELSQSMIDSLPEAIAVFDATGNLALSNDAYCELWGTDPELVLEQTGIVDATRLWQTKSLPTPLWGDVREFVCHAGDRTEWYGSTDLSDGRQLSCRFMPLAAGATLVGFTAPDDAVLPLPKLPELASLNS